MKRPTMLVFQISLAFFLVLTVASCKSTKVDKESSTETKTENSKPVRKTVSVGETSAKGNGAGKAPEKPVGTPVAAKPLTGELASPIRRSEDYGVFASLQKKLKFKVLYPGYMVAGFKLVQPETALQAIDRGVNGFELRYQGEGAGVTIMEGSVFNPSQGTETERIEIRNGTAYLETLDNGWYGVFFVQGGTRYGLSSDGISKDEIRKIATALVPLDEVK